MVDNLYEILLIQWLNNKDLVITETWELKCTEKTLAALFAEVKQAKTLTKPAGLKKRGFLYRLTHRLDHKHQVVDSTPTNEFIIQSEESEDENFIAWFETTYKTYKNRERLLSLLKFEYLSADEFKQQMGKLHSENVLQYLKLNKSSNWNQMMITAVLDKFTDNYKKYVYLYQQETSDFAKKDYYKMRIRSLQFFASKDGYGLLIEAIQKIFEMLAKRYSYNKVSTGVVGECYHAQNTLLLLGILYENAKAEENFYASIYLLKMLSSTDQQEFKDLIREFNKFFNGTVNLGPSSIAALTKANSDESATLEKYKPEIVKAYNRLAEMMYGCDRTEIEKLFLGETLEDEINTSSSSRRSISSSSAASSDNLSSSSRRAASQSGGLFDAFTLFIKRSHTTSFSVSPTPTNQLTSSSSTSLSSFTN